MDTCEVGHFCMLFVAPNFRSDTFCDLYYSTHTSSPFIFPILCALGPLLLYAVNCAPAAREVLSSLVMLSDYLYTSPIRRLIRTASLLLYLDPLLRR